MSIIDARASMRPVQNSLLNPVALVGFGPSREGHLSLPDYVPIWSLLDAESWGIPRVDAAFEMHQIRDVILESPRWNRLIAPAEYPIYSLETSPEWPSVVKYPLELVEHECFKNIYIGMEHAKYLDSSFPYMLALAVLRGHNPIFCYGFELKSDTEFSYQRIGAALLIGWAAGRGTSVILNQNNALLPPTLYGYEDYQMISRQNLEQFFGDIETELSDWTGQLNVAHAQVIEREKNGASKESLDDALERRNEAYKQMYMRLGAQQILGLLIGICDRKDQAILEFVDNTRIRTFDEAENAGKSD